MWRAMPRPYRRFRDVKRCWLRSMQQAAPELRRLTSWPPFHLFNHDFGRGKYHLGGVLGFGDSGVVLAATAREQRVELAVKLFNLTTFNAAQRQRLSRQIQSAWRARAALVHANICPVQRFAQRAHWLYVVTEQTPGCSLDATSKQAIYWPLPKYIGWLCRWPRRWLCPPAGLCAWGYPSSEYFL